MADRRRQPVESDRPGVSRRRFLKTSAGLSAGAAVGGALAYLTWPDHTVVAVRLPACEGYVLVDTKKCQGCVSCMLACSLVHEGEESLSRSRIQVIQDSFAKWPDDVAIKQCRQCVDPKCARVCVTGALTVDTARGNVRRVDQKKCNACLKCVEACPYAPGGPILVPDEKREADVRVEKCDLCADAPYHWDKGGPAGKQACVEVCPVGAIKFTKEIPVQEGDRGYNVNLRGKSWGEMGYPTD